MIIEEIKKILNAEECSCYGFDDASQMIVNRLSKEEARHDDCNNRVFTQITGILLANDISYEVTSNNDIILKKL